METSLTTRRDKGRVLTSLIHPHAIWPVVGDENIEVTVPVQVAEGQSVGRRAVLQQDSLAEASLTLVQMKDARLAFFVRAQQVRIAIVVHIGKHHVPGAEPIQFLLGPGKRSVPLVDPHIAGERLIARHKVKVAIAIDVRDGNTMNPVLIRPFTGRGKRLVAVVAPNIDTADSLCHCLDRPGDRG